VVHNELGGLLPGRRLRRDWRLRCRRG
jgi:hypothetical protein